MQFKMKPYGMEVPVLSASTMQGDDNISLAG